MAMLGIFNMSTGLAEGSDDPGRIYARRQNLLSILSVLSLVQFKGCGDDDNNNNNNNSDAPHPGLGLIAFTISLGLLFTFFWMCMPNGRQHRDEPDAEPAIADDPINEDSMDEAATLLEQPQQRPQR